MTEAAAGRAPPSSAAEAGRCAVNEAGLWEGKGQAQALACRSAGWGCGPASALGTPAHAGETEPLGLLMWVRWAPPGRWGTFTHTSTLDKSPLRNPDWLPQRDHVPQATAMIPRPHWQCQTPGSDGHTGTRDCSAQQLLAHFRCCCGKEHRSSTPWPCTLPGEARGKPCVVSVVPGRGLPPQRGMWGTWGLQGLRLQGRMGRWKHRSLVRVSSPRVGSPHTASHRLTCILDEEASR